MSNETNNNDDEELPQKTTRDTKKRISKLEMSKKMPSIEDTDQSNIDKINKDLKKNVTKRLKSAKKKKRKKKKEVEPVLLTEVKQNLLPKKVEEEKKESNTHKFLREK